MKIEKLALSFESIFKEEIPKHEALRHLENEYSSKANYCSFAVSTVNSLIYRHNGNISPSDQGSPAKKFSIDLFKPNNREDYQLFTQEVIVKLSEIQEKFNDKETQEKITDLLDKYRKFSQQYFANSLAEKDANNYWYEDNDIYFLLQTYMEQLNMTEQVHIIQGTLFEHDDALKANLETALKNVRKPNKKACLIPINLVNHHWVSLVLKRGTNNQISAIYLDSLGNTDKHGDRIRTLVEKLPDVDFRDLSFEQQCNGNDCGPLTVYNLITLATSNIELSSPQQIQEVQENLNEKTSPEVREDQKEWLRERQL